MLFASSSALAVPPDHDAIVRTSSGLLVHHGRINDRLYVMSIECETLQCSVRLREALQDVLIYGLREEYTKLLVKAPEAHRSIVLEVIHEVVEVSEHTGFLHRGGSVVREEVRILQYYPAGASYEGPAVYYCVYPLYGGDAADRGQTVVPQRSVPKVVSPFVVASPMSSRVRDNNNTTDASALSSTHAVDSDERHPIFLPPELCSSNDAAEIAAIFRRVFQNSYPFPVTEGAYVRQCIDGGETLYYCVREVVASPLFEGDTAVPLSAERSTSNKIAAVCAAEMDTKNGCAEMTDFATLPEYEGRGLASQLLRFAEQDLLLRSQERRNDSSSDNPINIRVVFTICRAIHPSVNRLFLRAGYAYNGTLIQNTHMVGEKEDMHVFSKVLTG